MLVHYSFMIYGVLFGAFFIKKLIPRIQEKTMLLFTILFWYGWTTHLGSISAVFNSKYLPIAIIPTLISIFAALSPYILPKFIRVIQYIWYLTITLSFSMILMDGHFWEVLRLKIPNEMSNLDLFLSGYTGLFVITNILYLYLFIPIPSKHQSIAERMEALAEYFKLLIEKYNNSQLKPVHSLLYIVIFSLILYLNYHYTLVSTTVVIGSSIALITVTDKIEDLKNAKPINIDEDRNLALKISKIK